MDAPARQSHFLLRPVLATARFFERRAAPAWTEQRKLYEVEKRDEDLKRIEKEMEQRRGQVRDIESKLVEAKSAITTLEHKQRDATAAKLAAESALNGPGTPETERLDAATKELEKAASMNIEAAPPALKAEVEEAKVAAKAAPEIAAGKAEAEKQAKQVAAGVEAATGQSPAAAKGGPGVTQAVAEGAATLAGATERALNADAREKGHSAGNDAKDPLARQIKELTALVGTLVDLLTKTLVEMKRLEQEKTSKTAERDELISTVKDVLAKLTPEQRKSEEKAEGERKAKAKGADKASKAVERLGRDEPATPLQNTAAAASALLKHPEMVRAKREAGKEIEMMHKDAVLLVAEIATSITKLGAALEIIYQTQARNEENIRREGDAALAEAMTAVENAEAATEAVEQTMKTDEEIAEDARKEIKAERAGEVVKREQGTAEELDEEQTMAQEQEEAREEEQSMDMGEGAPSADEAEELSEADLAALESSESSAIVAKETLAQPSPVPEQAPLKPAAPPLANQDANIEIEVPGESGGMRI